MKSFREYMDDSRAPRTPEERQETEGLNKVFEAMGLEGDDLIRDRARRHPTFFLRCHWENHPELWALQRFGEIKGKVLDFGCGSGHLTVMAAEVGYDIDGVDELESAITVARHVSKTSSAERPPKFWQADIANSEVSELYDSVWASHVFEHIKDPTEVFAGIKRWLKPDGHILIAVPFGDAYPDPTHVHRWVDLKEFEDFFSPWLDFQYGECDMNSGCIRALFQFK